MKKLYTVMALVIVAVARADRLWWRCNPCPCYAAPR